LGLPRKKNRLFLQMDPSSDPGTRKEKVPGEYPAAITAELSSIDTAEKVSGTSYLSVFADVQDPGSRAVPES
jgi:hypothetical protein